MISESMGRTLEKGYLMPRRVNIYKTYKISFDVYLTKVPHASWDSIIFLTATNKDCCDNGDRVIGLWIPPNSDPTLLHLHIAGAMNDNPNRIFNTETTYPFNQWIHINFEQIKNGGDYFFIATINGKEERREKNSQPQEFKNVLVYTSEPWRTAASGRIRKINIISTP